MTATGAPTPAEMAWQMMRELVLDNERRKEASSALGLSFARIKALRRIAESPLPMGALATSLGIEPPYMTLVVDDLERQGLVERRPHPSDRRAKLVVATARGRQAARRAEAILERPPPGLAGLPTEVSEALVELLVAVKASTNGEVPGGRALG